MALNIHIIDAGCKLHGKGGTLNHYFAKIASEELTKLGHQVSVIAIDDGFDPKAESDALCAADAVIVQTPGWWMSTPWQLKRYQDLVFGDSRLCGGDGRSRANPELKYGTGGKAKGKHYLLSSTWNAPLEAFNDPEQFFEGRGIDGVFMPLHKAFQFIGMSPLPSFIANDVIKNPQIEQDAARWRAHLQTVFAAL